MNCQEFEKKMFEDPFNTDEQFHQHRLQCKKCQLHFDEVSGLEKKILGALQENTEQNADEQFLQRLQQQLLQNADEQKRHNRKLLAIAAGFMLLLITGMVTFNLYQTRSMTDFVLAHIDHEIEQLDSTARISQSKLQHFIEKFDSHYLNVLQEVTYVKQCWMRGGYGLHLIFQGRNGAVSLLLIPGETVDNVLMVQSERFQGKVYAFREGSLALVGEPGEPIEMLAESLRMAMKN